MEDVEGREELVRRTGQMTVPVIVVGDEVVLGFDRARLTALLGI
jgi:glutaredoxin 3